MFGRSSVFGVQSSIQCPRPGIVRLNGMTNALCLSLLPSNACCVTVMFTLVTVVLTARRP